MEDLKMFDKLIVSEPEGADFKSRRRYFAASTLVVGAAFAVALVISIYASDYALGTDTFELTALVAPLDRPQTEPLPPQQRSPVTPKQSNAPVPTRQVIMQRTDEVPLTIPKDVSTAPNP